MGLWRPAIQSLAPGRRRLQSLRSQWLIEGEWPDPRKRTIRIYQLTDDGQQEMERLKAIVRPKLEEAIEVLQVMARDLNGHEGEKAGPDEVIYL